MIYHCKPLSHGAAILEVQSKYLREARYLIFKQAALESSMFVAIRSEHMEHIRQRQLHCIRLALC